MSDIRERERTALMKRYRDLMEPMIKAGLNTTLFSLDFYCRYLPAQDSWALTCRENNRHVDYNWTVTDGDFPKAAFQKEAEARARICIRKINDSDQSRFGRKQIIADPTQPDTSKGSHRTPTSYTAVGRDGVCRGLSAQDGERWEAVIDKSLLNDGAYTHTDEEQDRLEAADQRIIKKGEEKVRLTREAAAAAAIVAAETAAAEAFAAEEAKIGFYEGADTFGQF